MSHHSGRVALKNNAVLLALGYNLNGGTPTPDDGYDSIVNYATAQGFTLPSAPVQTIQNALLTALKNAGIWDKLDVFYCFFGDGDADFAKINWKNPGTHHAIGTGHEPTFIPNKGFKGNGTTQYLDTDFKLLSDSSAQPDFSAVFADSELAVFPFNGSYKEISGSLDSGLYNAILVVGNEGTYIDSSGAGGGSGNIPGLKGGFMHGDRAEVGKVARFVNGAAQSVVEASASQFNDINIYLLAFNQGNFPDRFHDGTISCFGYGKSMAGSAQTLYDLWSTYKAIVTAVTSYIKVLDYATAQGYTLPSDEQKKKQVELIYDLAKAGAWDKLDVFYNFVTDGDADFASINWKNPGTDNLLRNAGITFATNTGFKGNGTSGEANTQHLQASGPNMNVNSAGYFADYADPSDGGYVYGIGQVTGSVVGLLTVSPILISHQTSSSQAIQGAITSPNGLVMCNVTGLDRGLFKDGALLQQDTIDATMVFDPTNTLKLFSAQGFAFSSALIKCFGMGGSLAGLEMAVKTAWRKYSDAYAPPLTGYDAVLAYASEQGYTLPSADQQVLQRKLADDLIAAGIWEKLDVFYNFMGDGDFNFAKINWIKPGSFIPESITDISKTDVGLLTFPASSFSIPFVFATDGVNYKADDAGIFFDLSNGDTGVGYDVANQDGTHYTQVSIAVGGKDTVGLNTANFSTKDTTVSDAFFHAKRLNGNHELVANGVSLWVDPNVGNGLSITGPVTAFVSRNGAIYGCLGFGSALAGLESAFYTTWKAYADVVKTKSAYKKIIDYATAQGYTLPSPTQQDLQQALISDMVTVGIWDKLDVFYNFMGDGDENFALINWKAPGTNQALKGAGCTFVSNSGFKTSGVTGVTNVIDTNWVSSTEAVNFKDDDSSYGCFLSDYQHPDTGNGDICGAGVPRSGMMKFGATANSSYHTMYSVPEASIQGRPCTGIGMYHLARKGTLGSYFINGALDSSAQMPLGTATKPAGSFRMFGINLNGTSLLNTTSGMCWAGASLDGLEAYFYEAWSRYHSALRSDAAYKAIIDYATAQGYTLPSPKQQKYQRDLIYDLVSAGIWDKLDVFYNFFTNGDSDFAKINWKNPGTYQADGAGHEPVFTSNDGFTGDGTAAYLDTGWTPQLDANDSGFFFDIKKPTRAATFDLGVVSGSGGLLIAQMNSPDTEGSDSSAIYINGISSGAGVMTNESEGFYQVYQVLQNGNGFFKAFKNGVKIDDEGVSNDQTTYDASVFLLAYNSDGLGTPGGFSDAELRVFGAGKSLVGLEGLLNQAWRRYKKANGIIG